MASIKGYVWYSPAEFEENGYEIPATLDELTELSEQIAADSGRQPWCVGLESGDATGWPGTDWVEDYVLRLHGPEVYDQWVTHGIPFNDPQVAEAFDAVGEYLKSDEMVNAGIGDVSTQVTEAFQTAGLPILDGECSLHHQASFYETFWNPEGGDANTVASDGTVFGFLLPPEERRRPAAVTGGGEILGRVPRRRRGRGVPRTTSRATLWANNRVEPRRRHQREQGRRPRERVERAARAVDRDPAGPRDDVPVRRVRPDARCRRRRLLLEGHRGLGRR